MNTPIVADGAPRARGPAPEVGADTLAILGELGYDDERIAALVEDGIVGVPDADESACTLTVRGAEAQK